ncbi:MAG: hypothetical protein AB1756_02340 [Acidobacteriota bacterium]
MLYHRDNKENIEGYELVKDDRTLLVLWDGDHDGILNMWQYYINGESLVLVKDRNSDCRLDWWQLRMSSEAGRLAQDNDYDGIVDEDFEIRFTTKH